jgi:hypothetical protein
MMPSRNLVRFSCLWPLATPLLPFSPLSGQGSPSAVHRALSPIQWAGSSGVSSCPHRSTAFRLSPDMLRLRFVRIPSGGVGLAAPPMGEATPPSRRTSSFVKDRTAPYQEPDCRGDLQGCRARPNPVSVRLGGEPDNRRKPRTALPSGQSTSPSPRHNEVEGRASHIPCLALSHPASGALVGSRTIRFGLGSRKAPPVHTGGCFA